MSVEQGDYWLERYDEDQDVAHLDRAIVHYEAAIVPPGEDRDLLIATLAEAYRERFRVTVELGLPSGEAVPRRRAAAAGIARMVPEVGDDRVADFVRVLHGLSLLDIVPLTEEPTDLAAGIAVLAPALDRTDAGMPYYDEACASLCHAYLVRDEPGDLDRAIEAAGRARDSDNGMVHHALGCAYQNRWDVAGELSDLDLAIEHWRRALAVVAEPSGLAECGRLLGERGVARDDVDDAADAIALLEQAVAAGEPAWWYLGMAYYLRWKLEKDPADGEHAAEGLDRGLAEAPSPEWLVIGHRHRVTLAQERLEAEWATAPGSAPPGASRVLRQIDEAREVWDSGLGDPDDRGLLAIAMTLAALTAWPAHPDRVDTAWLREMLDAARELSETPPEWSSMVDALSSMGHYTEEALTGAEVPGEALNLLLGSLRRGDAGPELRESVKQMAPLFMAARGIQSGDLRMLRTAVDQMRASPDPEAHLFADAFELTGRAQQGDLAVRAELQSLLAELREEHISYVARQSLLPLITMLERVLASMTGAYQPLDLTPIAPDDRLAADHALQGLAGPVTAAVIRHDVATLRDVLVRIDELLAFFPAGHLLRLIALGLGCISGVALLRDEPGDQAAGRRVVRWTEDALGIAVGAHHPRWPTFALARAEALRHLDDGDRAESRRWGLAGLRGFAWQVQLQSGTDDAVVVAAEASAAAHRVAGWCRADEAHDDLLAALDAGRGLVLQAATTSRTIADRLAEAGYAGLAERWRSSGGYGSDVVTGDPLSSVAGAAFEVPDDLRTQVLHALDLSAPEPATAADIRAALTQVGADALVYLVPSSAEQPGVAVIVPAGGDLATLVLPGLITRPGSAFDRGAAGLRDAGPAVVHQAEATASTPDELCRWAWSAAIGPLLRHAAGWELNRPARLVLVPTGRLSAVPWHAAFHSQDGRPRYAVEDAVISYAISGRSFAENAREPVRAVKSVLIVGDPTGDLPFAGVEANAIGRVFYPDGTYLGVTAAEPGTPRQVLDWIATSAPGPSLLHLACHGHADPAHPADACLRLAGGELTARHLLESSRTAELEIERVFLAACTTGAAGADHDEAFSLASAFLAAGAHTVFGSLWKVPDEETSLLMFMVHHHLQAEAMHPVDALHHAQLWMLDPDRQPPATMPPELARHCRNPRTAEPRSWAAFTHQGR